MLLLVFCNFVVCWRYVLSRYDIAYVGWNVTLLESLNKRCVFLEHAVGVIGLSNVKVIRGRAEVCLSEN